MIVFLIFGVGRDQTSNLLFDDRRFYFFFFFLESFNLWRPLLMIPLLLSDQDINQFLV